MLSILGLMQTLFNQADFEIRVEWGLRGIAELAPFSDVVVIVDVLSFCTCVEIAVARGARVFPFRSHDESARAFAARMDAELAGMRGSAARYSLSPQSLVEIPRGTRLVLPSPNGSTLTLATAATPTLAGCLRNARATAHAAKKFGKHIAVVPAGERWHDGSLRPALEDWLGAGAILDALDGNFSPEARAAREMFRALEHEIPHLVAQCGSGQELRAINFARDVELASALNVSDAAAHLREGAYIALGE